MQAKAWRITVLAATAAVAALIGLPRDAAAATADVTDVRVGQHVDRTRLVLDLSESVNFSAFTLADPYRLVIDLPELDWRMAPDSSQQGGVITALRYGLFRPGTSRLVLDLREPAKIDNSFVLPPSEGKQYRLVFDLVAVDRAQFLADSGLNTDSADPTPAAPPPTSPSAARAPAKIAGLQPPASPTRKPSKFKRRVVVIDPGHGGIDPGAIAPSGAVEKNITLAAAKDFKRRLEATKRYEVYLTREKDEFIRLRDRIAIARGYGADLFISLHADILPSKRVRGLSVYTLSEKASDKEAADLAEKENKADVIAGIDLSSESQNVTNILIDLAQRETMNESSRFAGHLVSELRSVSKILPQAHRFAGFAVLKAPDVPSVLLEMGFLSNPLDERALNDPAYRARMADSLAAAVARFFRSVERADRR